MPTYSYKCTECGTAFDIQQAFTDDSLTVCPNCGGQLRKVFTAIGVSFNGSGFYRNDSKADARKPTKKAEPKGSDARTSDSSSSDSSSSPSPSSASPAPKTPAAPPAKAAG